MKKTFKETKFGKLITEKLPDVAALVGDALPDQGLLGIIKNAIDMSTLSKEEKKELQDKATEFELTELKMILEDKANARNMQVEALRQSDVFSKRFIYYFSGFWSVFSAAYLAGITFISVPTDSIRIVDTVLGFILGTAITMMFSYFYGSSAGAAKRNDTVYDLIKK